MVPSVADDQAVDESTARILDLERQVKMLQMENDKQVRSTSHSYSEDALMPLNIASSLSASSFAKVSRSSECAV